MTRLAPLLAGLLLPLLGLFSTQDSALAEDDTEMIVGGTPAPEGKYLWQVRLYDSMEDEKGSCGGSLIAAQWVLTAAHCMYAPIKDPNTHGWSNELKRPIEAKELVVGYGSIDRKETTKVEVAEIFVHPRYLACEGRIQCSDEAKPMSRCSS